MPIPPEDKPPMVPVPPSSRMVTQLPDEVAEDVLVGDLCELMLREFGKERHDGHLIIDPPRSSRVVAKSMRLFEAARSNVTVVQRPCTHRKGETNACFIFTRRRLF